VSTAKESTISQAVTIADKNLTNLARATHFLPAVTGTVTIPNLAPLWNTLNTDDFTVAPVPHSQNGALLQHLLYRRMQRRAIARVTRQNSDIHWSARLSSESDTGARAVHAASA